MIEIIPDKKKDNEYERVMKKRAMVTNEIDMLNGIYKDIDRAEISEKICKATRIAEDIWLGATVKDLNYSGQLRRLPYIKDTKWYYGVVAKFTDYAYEWFKGYYTYLMENRFDRSIDLDVVLSETQKLRDEVTV